MPHSKWDRVKKELKLIKLDKKIDYNGRVRGNYVLHVKQGSWYPRFHLQSKFVHRKRTDIDIHIDWKKHKEADGFHELIDNLVEKIKLIL